MNLIGLRGETTTIILSSEHSIKQPSESPYLEITAALAHQKHTTLQSLCSEWCLMQELRQVKVQRVSDYGCSATIRICISHPLPKAQRPSQKGQKDSKGQRLERTGANWSRLDHHTLELILLWWPAHYQMSQHSRQEGAQESPPLTKELPTVDGSCKRKSQFSLRAWLLVCPPCFQ